MKTLMNASDYAHLMVLVQQVKEEPRKFSKAKALANEVERVLTNAKNLGLIKE